ncbi:MAG: acyl-CoA thioesterase [Rubrobacter sp.]|nr:acyl-CoA thioesterase [Rubrobacter sp.]
MGDFPFAHTLRVRYSEIDGQKVVYNAHYLTYLDVAITEYFRNLGIEFLDSSLFDIALVRATLDFRRPARLDDLLDVWVSIPRLGNSSFTGRFRILPHGESSEKRTVLDAEIVYVSFSAEEGRAVPIPGWVREKIESFEGRTSSKR